MASGIRSSPDRFLAEGEFFLAGLLHSRSPFASPRKLFFFASWSRPCLLASARRRETFRDRQLRVVQSYLPGSDPEGWCGDRPFAAVVRLPFLDPPFRNNDFLQLIRYA